jgi:hypothetical protein
VSQTATQIAKKIEAAQKRQITVTDIRSPNAGDGRGMTSFYLVLGWVIGCYLTATIMGMASGSRPANRHRTLIRLGVLVLYAAVSGIAGAVIVGPLFGALGGHFWALSCIGTLVVLASAATALALQTLLGLLGTGLVILLFAVLGSPSSGGLYPAPLLPSLWSDRTGSATRRGHHPGPQHGVLLGPRHHVGSLGFRRLRGGWCGAGLGGFVVARTPPYRHHRHGTRNAP